MRLFGSFYYEGDKHKIRLDNRSGVTIQNVSESTPYVDIQPEWDLLSARIPQREQIDLPFDDRYIPHCLDLDSEVLEFRYVYASPNLIDFLPDPSNPADLIRYIERFPVENEHGFFGALNQGDLSVTVNTLATLVRGSPSL